jgi:hypothetical protein
MKRMVIRALLAEELMRLSKLTFEQALAFSSSFQKNQGTVGEDDFCQLDIRLLEQHTDETGTWLNIVVSANDGKGSLGLIPNVSGSVIFYENANSEIIFPD